MSAFPDWDQLEGTIFIPFDNTETQESEGGERVILPAFKAAHVGRIGEFRVLLEVDASKKTTLNSHYTTNRRIRFDFVEKARPTITWQCLWGPKPAFDRKDHLGTAWVASCILWAITNDEPV